MKTPVLFVVFNRPEPTRRVFEAIRAARPPRLYVAADGPRADRPEEAARCEQVRAVVAGVDWPCEVFTLFRPRNLGCKHGVSGAVTWFFTHEPEGIILEDDILPQASFFDYCEQLLQRYRDDHRVAMISGCNLVSRRFQPVQSYFFSRYNHIWGWASWRRAWSSYDVAMAEWPAWRDAGGLSRICGGDRRVETYWRYTLDAAYAGRINTWDYQWTFACWRQGGLSALPAANQTGNLGFGSDSTHTVGDAPKYVLESRPALLEFPLAHPGSVERDERADALIDREVFGIGPAKLLRLRLAAVPVLRNTFRALKLWIRGFARQTS